MCLLAQGAGLLELMWDLVCPSCQMGGKRFATLGDFHRALENSGYTSLMKVTRTQRATQAAMLENMRAPMPAWKRGALGTAALVLLAAMVGGGLMSGQAHALYVVGVLWCLITAIVVFVVQIFRLLPLDPRD